MATKTKELSPREASHLYGLSAATVAGWAKKGHVKARKARKARNGGRNGQWLVDAASLENWVNNGRSQQSRSMQATRADRKWGGGTSVAIAMPEPIAGKADALLTTHEVAEISGRSVSWVLSEIRFGRLSAIRMYGNRGPWLIARQDLEARVESDGHAPMAQDTPRLQAVPELLDKLEVVLRELRYAYAREQKVVKTRIRAGIEEVLAGLEN